MSNAPAIEDITVAVYRVPTDAPEADGTLEWTETTMVAVHARAGDETGYGYTYADPALAGFGGPASPRGYVRLGANSAGPWEAREEPVSAP